MKRGSPTSCAGSSPPIDTVSIRPSVASIAAIASSSVSGSASGVPVSACAAVWQNPQLWLHWSTARRSRQAVSTSNANARVGRGGGATRDFDSLRICRRGHDNRPAHTGFAENIADKLSHLPATFTNEPDDDNIGFFEGAVWRISLTNQNPIPSYISPSFGGTWQTSGQAQMGSTYLNVPLYLDSDTPHTINGSYHYSIAFAMLEALGDVYVTGIRVKYTIQ